MMGPDLVDHYDVLEQEIDIAGYLIAADNIQNAEQRCAKKRRLYSRRKVYLNKDPRISLFYIDYRDPEHRDGKLFRRRFFHDFNSITSISVELEKEENYFWKSKTDAFKRPAHPVRLLVLAGILTRNVTLDCMQEVTYISSSVIGAFFKLFVHWYATTVFPKVVRTPEANQEVLRCNGAEYIAAGFPWALASLDVVHIRLWEVSANLKQLSTGKEKFPSRAFELACNNRRFLLSATKGFMVV